MKDWNKIFFVVFGLIRLGMTLKCGDTVGDVGHAPP